MSAGAPEQGGAPPRRTTRSKRLPPAERRAQLLACALRVFARRGLGRAAHAEVAEEAGVAVSTAFLYFPNREALVDAVLDEVERFYLGMAERIHTPEQPAREVIRRHGSAFLDSLESHPDHTRVWLDWSTAYRNGIWPRYEAFNDQLIANHRRTIERGQAEGTIAADVDADLAARFHIGSALMHVQMKLRGLDEERLRKIGRTVLAASLGELRIPE